MCPHPGKDAAALGQVSSQLRSQPFPPELPRTRASPAGCGRNRAKDACQERGRHVREPAASHPGDRADAGGGGGSPQMWPWSEARSAGGVGTWPAPVPQQPGRCRMRSCDARSPNPLLPAASQGREGMLSQGTVRTAGPPAMQHPHACPFPASCPAAGGQAIVGALACRPLLSPSCPGAESRDGCCAGGDGTPHAILSPPREAPAEQVEGFLPLPITHISPVN